MLEGQSQNSQRIFSNKLHIERHKKSVNFLHEKGSVGAKLQVGHHQHILKLLMEHHVSGCR